MAPRRTSKRLQARTATPPPRPAPFTNLPPEITSLIFSYMDDYSSKDLYRSTRVCKSWYTGIIPLLYQRLKVSERNVKKLFHGFDIDIKDEKFSIDDFFDGSDEEQSSSDQEEEERRSETRNKSLIRNSKINGRRGKNARLGEWNFGLKSEDVIERKLENLQYVKCLVISDWKAAKAITQIIKHPNVESSTTPFSNIETLAFGIGFLKSREFYPGCACDTEPKSNSVVRHLASLTPKHVCANWYASVTYHQDEDGFNDYMEFLIGKYKLKSFTWHGINFTSDLPWFPKQASSIRIFCRNCGEPDGNYDDEGEETPCQCETRLKFTCIEAKFAANESEDKVEVEIINLTCLGDIDDEDIDEKGNYNPNEVESNDGDFPKAVNGENKPFKITVSSRASAEACICCGQK